MRAIAALQLTGNFKGQVNVLVSIIRYFYRLYISAIGAGDNSFLVV